MTAIPKISDFQSEHKYNAGDRLIVRVPCPITKQQQSNICQSINTWAGVDLRILVVDASRITMEWKSGLYPVAYPLVQLMERKAAFMGVCDVKCGKVDLADGDRLIVHNAWDDELDDVKRWVGELNVEITSQD